MRSVITSTKQKSIHNKRITFVHKHWNFISSDSFSSSLAFKAFLSLLLSSDLFLDRLFLFPSFLFHFFLLLVFYPFLISVCVFFVSFYLAFLTSFPLTDCVESYTILRSLWNTIERYKEYAIKLRITQSKCNLIIFELSIRVAAFFYLKSRTWNELLFEECEKFKFNNIPTKLLQLIYYYFLKNDDCAFRYLTIGGIEQSKYM